MYYEEKYVGGILCSRGLPDAEFVPLTKMALCGKLKHAEKVIADKDKVINNLHKVMLRITTYGSGKY